MISSQATISGGYTSRTYIGSFSKDTMQGNHPVTDCYKYLYIHSIGAQKHILLYDLSINNLKFGILQNLF